MTAESTGSAPGLHATEARRSPLAGRADLAAVSGGVSLAEVPFLAMIDLRVPPGSVAASEVAAVLGFDLPGPARAATSGDRSALWLGPDEWLVVGPDGDGPALLDLLTGVEPGCAVDVSANRTAVRVSGSHARAVLEKGCAIDLHPQATQVPEPGQRWCSVTLLSRVSVIVWQQPDGYLLLVRPSFANYLADWLIDAALEYSWTDDL